MKEHTEQDVFEMMGAILTEKLAKKTTGQVKQVQVVVSGSGSLA